MKIKVNRNHLWARIFIDQLVAFGVQYACISPGSRSTPLTFTLSKNRRIKSFVNIDERSSAFFALGLAKATGKPVLIVTTSGTAVAELYPAIIEAFQQRVPLIVCTADRPSELIGTGANQTINQHNIFKNHIKWFRDLGLPSISETGLRHLQRIAIRSFHISLIEDRGPVHLNFPFRKPLEPFSYTDDVNKSILKIKPQHYSKSKIITSGNSSNQIKSSIKITDDLIKYDRGIIIVGPMEYDRELNKKIKKLSGLLKYPIFADGVSQLRFGSSKKDKNIIANFNAILQSENFVYNHDPDIILQFGRTPTSSTIEKFLSESNADRYLINHFGDLFDPTRNAKATFQIEPKVFCESLITHFKVKKISRQKSNWIKDFIKAEEISDKIKTNVIEKSKFPNEPSVITEIFKSAPSGSNVFIGNSLPVRDLDNFLGKLSKGITLHFNRGASGIDGITSTALAIATIKKPTLLITGDLSFLHDLNALSIAQKFSIPITIIVINNNGGGIFETLPIAQKVNHFSKFFIAPHDLDLSGIVKSFGISHQIVHNRSQFKSHIIKCMKKKSPSVLEIRTNAVKSADLRINYFNEVKKKINKEFLK